MLFVELRTVEVKVSLAGDNKTKAAAEFFEEKAVVKMGRQVET